MKEISIGERKAVQVGIFDAENTGKDIRVVSGDCEKTGDGIKSVSDTALGIGKAAQGISDNAENALKTVKQKRKRRKKDITSEILKPLKIAAEHIADMLCALSGDEDLFVVSQEAKQSRRIDTKTLKEFSSVIKEITGVICELNGITTLESGESAGSVKIEFDDDAGACSQ